MIEKKNCNTCKDISCIDYGCDQNACLCHRSEEIQQEEYFDED